MKRAFAVLLLLSAYSSATTFTSGHFDGGEVRYLGDQHPEDSNKKTSNSVSVQQWRMAPPPPWDASAGELERKGDELRGMKAPADALDYYRAALEKTPKKDRSTLYNKCGITELQLSRFDEAQRDFVNSIKRDKKNSEAVNNLGVVYFFKDNYGKAISIYQKAIALDPTSAAFHGNLGRAYFAHKQYELAGQEYAKALDIDPDIFSRESPGGIVARMPQEKGLFSYVLAKLLASHGRIDESLVYLRRAMDEGYKGVDKIYTEPDFAKLIKDPRFTEMMNARNAGQPQPQH
ncbi:MAG TPA: tetratricopeptide repeat protein [Terriglobales bacterium]|jgi:tetratricopeptide (TPR) repeat protein|nr:tetratricopeptide repeat protein [Terriglobales bacterium]